MSDYRRWISYIYAYENGVKKKSAGYAKLELKDGKLTMTLHVTPDGREGNMQICMYKCHAGSREGILLGSVEKKQGGEGARFEENAADLRGSGLLFQEMNGLLLYDEKGKYLISSWEDEPVEISALQEIVAQLEQRKKKMENRAEKTGAEDAAKGGKTENEAEEKRTGTDAANKRGMNENEKKDTIKWENMEGDAEKKKENNIAHGGKAEYTAASKAAENALHAKITESAADRKTAENKVDTKSAENTSDGKMIEKAAENAPNSKAAENKAERKAAENAPSGKMPESAAGEINTGRQTEDNRRNENRTWKNPSEEGKKAQSSWGIEAQSVNSGVTSYFARTPDNGSNAGARELHTGDDSRTQTLRPENISAAGVKTPSQPEAVPEEKEEAVKKEALTEKETASEKETLSGKETGSKKETLSGKETASEKETLSGKETASEKETLLGKETGSKKENFEEKETALEKENFEEKETASEREISEEKETSPEKNAAWTPGRLETRLFSCLPAMYPFEHQEFERSVRMEPQDIGLLPREMWKYAGNSFLLHSYYAYHHILFARKVRKEQRNCYLMLPGVYNPKEQHMAQLFGFSRFCPVRKKPLQQGDFGYWYMEVQFPD